jgi:crotonobetainyl-CoA:carnitine CoA-transferase CaiB-like acyl-CoA transferase
MLRMLGLPVKLSGTPGGIRRPPPRLGEHTRAVLRDDLGVDEDTLRRWAETGAFGSALQKDLRHR